MTGDTDAGADDRAPDDREPGDRTPDDRPSNDRAPDGDPGEEMSAEPVIRVSNEFSHVEVRKVRTPRGERLEIRDPRSGHSIRIDALGLESLTWQDAEIFSEFLREPDEPFGPDGEHD